MPFGISNTGFELKRLPDILSEQRQTAKSIFQDLLLPDEVVDTSDSSTIGRYINLFSPAYNVSWQQLQLVYSSFDPNTASGIALDNLVQYLGLSRLASTFSSTSALFKGDLGVQVTLGSVIGSDTAPDEFEVTSTVSLTPSSCSGIDISIASVVATTDYTVSYTIGSSTNTVTYNSGGSPTEDSILAGINTEISTSHPNLTSSVVDGNVVITKTSLFQLSTFTVSSNLTIEKVAKIGNVRAVESGPIPAEVNSLTIIKTPIIGWDSVINPVSVSIGNDRETDEELRLRFRNTKFERSSNLLDSLYSRLSVLDGVTSVAVYENNTSTTDVNGIPPHSFSAVILGGDDTEIADTIWINKPVGIGTHGSTTVVITDSQDFPRQIKFQRPDPVNIYISANITTFDGYPADGIDQIKSAIINYANENFSVGDDVIYSRLYTPINSIPGHQVNSLFIGTAPSPVGVANITIPFDEIASFQAINIIIVETP